MALRMGGALLQLINHLQVSDELIRGAMRAIYGHLRPFTGVDRCAAAGR
eukprot:SAG11_NODE_1846_length_4172_cov_3.188313_3_plen_49_part_00